MSECDAYAPTGKAAEYSPLALNVYTGGCQHGCEYCYCRRLGKWSMIPKVRDLKGLERSAYHADRQVMLSFMSDPYQPCESEFRNTRTALHILKRHRCSVSILTKGGTRCLRDLDLFRDWPDNRISVGATMTFCGNIKKSLDESRIIEPGAAFPFDRMAALRELHRNGIQTWISLEPVLSPIEATAIIHSTYDFIDFYKVGKLNHSTKEKQIDWRAFGQNMAILLRSLKKRFYVKKALQEHMAGFHLSEDETNPERFFLPDRPKR